MEKICESCGMPMVKPEDFGGKDTSNKYCIYCTYENGELKSFEEKWEDMTAFITKTTDLSAENARKMAKENLLKQPAWSHLN